MSLKSWSYSSLTTFENCPRQFEKTRVTKEVIDMGSDATREGTRVHEAFELYVRDGKPLPLDLQKFAGMAQTLASFPGEVYTEIPLAIDANMQPLDVPVVDGEVVWPENAWCKGIIDVLLIKGSRAIVMDYKTGKMKPESKQLMLMAGLVFAKYPQITRVDTSFIWLKVHDTTDTFYLREDLGLIWLEFLPRVKRLEKAYLTDTWTVKPSGLCSWCPCTKAHCQFAKK